LGQNTLSAEHTCALRKCRVVGVICGRKMFVVNKETVSLHKKQISYSAKRPNSQSKTGELQCYEI